VEGSIHAHTHTHIHTYIVNLFVPLYIQWTSGYLCVQGSKDRGSNEAAQRAQAMPRYEPGIEEQEFVWNERESPWSRHLYKNIII